MPLCRYEGRWQTAMYSGHGSETFSKGSTYLGQYNSGLRNGSGACRFFNGDYYEGDWAHGLRDGQGMQQVCNPVFFPIASCSCVSAADELTA